MMKSLIDTNMRKITTVLLTLAFIGAGSFTAMPGLGNVGSANVSFTQPIGERLVVTAGLSGNKYHFGRDAWNDYGIYAVRGPRGIPENLSVDLHLLC